jgi:6-phosphofructokinase
VTSRCAVVAHGGGPTTVINASLAGVVEACRGHYETVWGARFGVEGLLASDFVNLTAQDTALLKRVGEAPGSAIGSSRRRLDDDDYPRIFEVLRKRNVDCLFYTGGNGSMSTALAFQLRARAVGFDLQVIGIPKTIDNDLAVTDHSPGYASTARYFACAARDAGEDNRSLPAPICVLEVLGRNSGWVAAATSLARADADDAPHLIYLPERRVSLDQIASDVDRVYQRLKRVVVAVCEGQRDTSGAVFGAQMDRAQSAVHALASNLGHTLANALTERLGLRARAEKPGLVARSSGLCVLAMDREEAWRCGYAAGAAAARGESGVMVAIRREMPYSSTMFLTPLETVARVEKLLPCAWISPEGNDVTAEFGEWARPLIGPVDAWPRLAFTQPSR